MKNITDKMRLDWLNGQFVEVTLSGGKVLISRGAFGIRKHIDAAIRSEAKRRRTGK